jgi:hypothetical protein
VAASKAGWVLWFTATGVVGVVGEGVVGVVVGVVGEGAGVVAVGAGVVGVGVGVGVVAVAAGVVGLGVVLVPIPGVVGVGVVGLVGVGLVGAGEAAASSLLLPPPQALRIKAPESAALSVKSRVALENGVVMLCAPARSGIKKSSAGCKNLYST